MIKSFLTQPILLTPLMLNFFMILLASIPSESKKFILHPMMFLILLMFTTFSISLKMSFMYKSWIPFILFLTVIGGLLVMFLYIISLASNEPMNFNWEMMIYMLLKILIILSIFMFLNLYFYEYIYINSNLNDLMKFHVYSFNNMESFNIMYKKYYNTSTVFIIMYLYYSMLIMVNICSIHKAPLRQIMF